MLESWYIIAPDYMKQPNTQYKVAIVCDWLTNMGGAEKVVLAMHEAFPDAPIYTSVYTPERIPAFRDADVRTTYLQKLPGPLRKLHKFFPMLRVRAFRSLDLSDYDIILSSVSAEAKQVRKTRDDQLHICYCHTPIRYYWSHYDQYRADPGFGRLNWLVRLAMPFFVPPLKRADYRAAQDVDIFLANSNTVKDRIKKYYGKTATTMYPPVDTKRFAPSAKRDDYYVTIGRQIPYKRHDLAVRACTELGVTLKVFGYGSEHQKLRDIAGKTIEFYTNRFGNASDQSVEKALNHTKGFIFPAEEDFGIVSVEAMAAGAPVIAYSAGGSSEIVSDAKVGVLFDEQTTSSVVDAIRRAEATKFSPTVLRNRAKRFDRTLFVTQIRNFVHKSYQRKTR